MDPIIHYRTRGKLEKAGLAIIGYDKNIEEPERHEEYITIPQNEEVQIFQLDVNFCQFLVLINPEEPSNKNNGTTTHDAWFGGTDERPFLVKLTRNYWFEIWKNEKFYDTIKPDVIMALESVYGLNKSKRQGDIFAYELPSELQSWDKIRAIMMIGGQTTNRHKNHSLFDTRHKIDGNLSVHYHPNLIGSGTITAFDHADLVLDKLHVLAQTKLLENPENAD